MTKNTEDKFNPVTSTKLFGYQDYFSVLTKLYEGKKFPKVLLLTGEKGSGKFTLAFHLVNFFLTNKSNKPYDFKNLTINTENDFYKRILLNVNESFIYLGKNEGKKVSVEEIREVKKKFSTTPLNNLPRFTILDDADLLNTSSANALLKLIEEPSDSNYFILINNRRKKIIETLKSRSIEIKIFLNENQKENIFKNLIQKFGVSTVSYLNFISKTTPGTLLRVVECLERTKINDTINLYSSVDTLLDKFKKDKSEIYLETIKFLLDIQIEKTRTAKSYDPIKLGLVKKNITKLLFEYENFTLSKNSVLESFKSLPNNV